MSGSDPVKDEDINTIDFSSSQTYPSLKKEGFDEKLFSLIDKLKRKKEVQQEPLEEPHRTFVSELLDKEERNKKQSLPDNNPANDKPESKFLSFINKYNPFRKKNTIEIARDQIKYPAINKSNAVINGLALVVFCAGAFILYSELPGHVELVIGIILVSIAGNVIIGSR